MTTSTSAPTVEVPLRAEDLSCPPRFATPRTPERETLGPGVAAIAVMLGLPLMEWQLYVVYVLLEIDPDTGELIYTDWLLTVPRQSGKSTLILAKSTHRATQTSFFGRRQVIKYTAQNRLKAREKWEKDYLETLQDRPRFRSKFEPTMRNGSEEIVWRNRSRFGIESNTEKAGHGSTIDEAYVDEAFAQEDARLEDAFSPAMSTRRNRQLGLISTMGWEDVSHYFNAKVEAGRALVALQLVDVSARRGTAVFEWSAADDADPASVETWLATMPALHRPGCDLRTCRKHTQRIATIQGEYDKAAREGKLSGFRRAYLNQSVKKPKATESATLPTWSACGLVPDDHSLDLVDVVEGGEDGLPAPEAIGIGVSFGGEWNAIASSGWWEDRTVHLDAVDRRPADEVIVGEDGEARRWVVAEALRIQGKYDCQVLIHEKCADADLPRALEDAGVVLTKVTAEEYVEACASLATKVRHAEVTHLRYPELDDAVAGSKWRPVGNRQVWDLKKSSGPIEMLDAATLALRGCEREADPSVYWL